MKMYLKLEGKLGPKPRPQPQSQLGSTQPHSSTSAHLQNTNPMSRKAPGPKTSDKRKRSMLAKRRYKERVLTQPIPSIATSTAPAHMVATVSTQTPVVRSAAESIQVTVYKLAIRKFAEVSCLTTRPQNEGSNLPPLEDISMAQSDRVLLGLAQGQLLRTYLKQERTGQFPLHQTHTCTHCENRSSTPK